MAVLARLMGKTERRRVETNPDNLSKAKRRLFQIYLRGNASQVGSVTAVARRDPISPPPLSLTQEQLWICSYTADPGLPIYNESVTIHRTGPVNVDALERSLSEIVRRHEIWRTTFEIVDGRPVQVIHPPTGMVLRVHDIRRLLEAERKQEALRLASEDARRPFNLKQGPLVRARLVRLEDQTYRLCITAHQIVVDGESVYEVFPSELVRLYEAFSAGRPSPLKESAIQYADYAYWQRSAVNRDVLKQQVTYWKKQLAGELPVLRWPADRPRSRVRSYRGAIRPFELRKSLVDDLRRLACRERVTLFIPLLVALTALLHVYTGQTDIIVGAITSSGRKRPEFRHLLGYFLNSVALRSNLADNPTLRELMQRARATTLEALENDDVPLEHLIREMNLSPDPSRHPLFQIVISLVSNTPDLGSGWSMTPMDVESGSSKWDLYLELNERTDGILGRAQYNPDLFEPAGISTTLQDLESISAAITQNPDLRVSDAAQFTSRRTP
jgi:surfactin family lipopeptide synthetase A